MSQRGSNHSNNERQRGAHNPLLSRQDPHLTRQHVLRAYPPPSPPASFPSNPSPIKAPTPPQTLGSFAADFNATHVYNPRWPPHAKFHNGQTMALAVLLSATSTALLYKSGIAGSGERKTEYLFWASVVGSLYFVAGLCAILVGCAPSTYMSFAGPVGILISGRLS